jgi:cobalt-zinc-cadmium efflux system outer membrane protein
MGINRHVVMLALGTLALTGCLSPVRQNVDAIIAQRASLAVDLAAAATPLPPKEAPERPLEKVTLESRLLRPAAKGANVPGSEAPEFELPVGFQKLSPAEQQKVLQQFFPQELRSPLGHETAPAPGPDGRPLTLADLQRLAREHSPLLRQAADDIITAEGAALQAGMYPNPTFGLATNSIGPNGGPLMGPTIQQTIKTMGKPKLAQAAAAKDLETAQLAYRKAESDVMTSVRTSYYAVLVADASIRANRALAGLTDEVYSVLLEQLQKGQGTANSAMQVGVFAAQARVALVQARNAYFLAWRQLASAMGLTGMPPTELAGSLEHNLPRFDYEKALAHILANHTDTLTARTTIEKMRYNLRLNEVTAIPDVTLSATVSYDATPPGPPRWVTFFNGTMPIPVWDHNQGGIKQAQGQLMRAIDEPHRVRAALSASFADAFRRLEENRAILVMYRRQMLPQQLDAFRATVRSHYKAPPELIGAAALTDLIQAEQGLVGLIATYLTTLGSYWQAVSDVASLLQTDDAYQMAIQVEDCALTDVANMLKLPCCHPSASAPAAMLGGISPFAWPPGYQVVPGEQAQRAPAEAPKPAPPATPIAPPPAAPALGAPIGATPLPNGRGPE